jgi:hypothetical protein
MPSTAYEMPNLFCTRCGSMLATQGPVHRPGKRSVMVVWCTSGRCERYQNKFQFQVPEVMLHDISDDVREFMAYHPVPV